MDPPGTRCPPRHPARAARRLAAIAALLLTLAPGAARATDEALGEHVRTVLDAARARIADCGDGPVSVASVGATGQGLAERAPLRWNPRLARAAARHAGAMARTRLLDHVGADGSTVRDRVEATGYRWRLIGENLAAGHAGIEEAVAGWLADPVYCTVLLDGRFTEFGIARIETVGSNDPHGIYWTLVLGRPR
jgi:hypothetical protein